MRHPATNNGKRTTSPLSVRRAGQAGAALCVLLGVLALASCGTGRVLRQAEQHYARGEYFEAAAKYKRVYSRTSPKKRAERGVLAYKQADCYRRINYTTRAKGAYMNAVRYHYPDSIAFFYLAETLRKNGEYPAAQKHYETYLAYAEAASPQEVKDAGHDTLRLEAARRGLEAARLSKGWKQNPSRYTVKRVPSLVSRRSDYAPKYAGEDPDVLYYTSTRNEAKGDELNPITGTKSADIFSSKRNDRLQWQKPEPLASDVNSEYEDGACCFTADGKTMYFTRCRTADVPTYAEIYVSQRTGADWGAPQKCQLAADSLSSYAHPAISPAGDFLYFVSDMPGGQGGLDIWRAKLTHDGYGYVENVGADINTDGDEMFPVFAPDGSLYFSSTGHPGMGGLDIFHAVPDSTGNHWRVSNLGYPMNSQGDDFGMTFEPGAPNRGFFSTNRGDARGWDHIYSFEYPLTHHVLQGVVADREGNLLQDAVVTIAGTDGSYLKVNTKRDGTFSQELEPGREYALLAACRGFLNEKQAVATDTLERDSIYRVSFALASITRPVLIENIFYEFDSAELTPASTTALDELVTLLQDNPTVTIELAAHCDYFGKSDYNLRLSQRRAESVVRYLIAHGIAADRLTPKGYGEDSPKVVDDYTLKSAPFLKLGDVLTEEFILGLTPEQQEVCNAINRRTEFQVLRTTYGM